jgi:hypothetical protein
LRNRNAADPLVAGESLGGQFSYHIISSAGPNLIHFSRSRRPEIVLFGQRQKMKPPAFLYAGKYILVKGLDDGRLRVTRFAAGAGTDQQEVCEADVDQMIRAIVKLDGGYGEVMQAMFEARQGGYLESKIAVDAVARPGRSFRREGDDDSIEENQPAFRVSNPIPELFSNRLDAGEEKRRRGPDEITADPDEENDGTDGSFMGRMVDWFSR